MGSTFKIVNATVLSMADGDSPFEGEVRVDGATISHVGPHTPDADTTVDASGGIVMPGFVQSHVHLCQTLFRNLADDLSLLDWLRLRVWPMEAALGPSEMRASADLGLAELIWSGTTTILDMGSVHHTDAIGEAVAQAGSRAFIGKAMMDRGEGVPAGLREQTDESIRESIALAKRWNGAAEGRIGYAYAPRFAPSCSRELLCTVSDLCRRDDLIIHTHCAESPDEIALVRKEHNQGNLEFLDSCGMTSERSVFAHMIHLDQQDIDIVRRTRTAIAHCPSSNCKLGSGIAPIPRYLELGMKVSLGADGAPCNNNLDAFTEMRLAALIHKPRFGPRAMDARTVLRLATIDGARALGIDDKVGTLEPGKRADIAHLRLGYPFNGVVGEPYAQIVYTGSRVNVHDVWCDGRRLVKDGRLTEIDPREVMARGREAIGRVLARL